MTKPTPEKSARKRPTREQLSERLAIPLGPKKSAAKTTGKTTSKADSTPPPVDEASRQRIRDRAGD